MDLASRSPESDGGEAGRRRVRSIVAFVAGVLLIAAAVWAVVDRRAAVAGVMEAAASPAGVMLIVGVAASSVASWWLTSLSFYLLTRRYGHVGFGEMGALIGAAWLLNHLPMRPGMIGRLAYHRAVNGIAVSDSVRVIVQNVLCAAGAMVLGLLGALCLPSLGDAWTVPVLGAPLVVLLAGAALGRRSGVAAGMSERLVPVPLMGPVQPWRLLAAMAVRYVDLLVWAIRYLLLFELVGHPMSVLGAMSVAVAAQVASFAPVQMGLREWTVGITRAVLPASVVAVGAAEGAGRADAAVVGVAADLVNRGIELACVLPVGGLCAAWLWRRRRGAAGGSATDRTVAPMQ